MKTLVLVAAFFIVATPSQTQFPIEELGVIQAEAQMKSSRAGTRKQ
jgi:hypothetical protein